MPTFSAYNALGTTIEAAEMNTGLKLLEAGEWSSATAIFDKTSLTERDFFVIYFTITSTESNERDIRVTLNGSSSGYEQQNMSNATPGHTTGQSYLRGALAKSGAAGSCTMRIVNAKGANHYCFADFGYDTAGGNMFTVPRQQHLGSAAITRITAVASNSCSGKYAIYYPIDLEL